jgi:hypothetical protein
MKYAQILFHIANSNLSSEELVTLNSFVIDTLKAKRNMEGALIKQSLRVGSTVMVDHPNQKGIKFTVESIRRTKATIVDGSGTRASAPLNMLIPM